VVARYILRPFDKNICQTGLDNPSWEGIFFSVSCSPPAAMRVNIITGTRCDVRPNSRLSLSLSLGWISAVRHFLCFPNEQRVPVYRGIPLYIAVCEQRRRISLSGHCASLNSAARLTYCGLPHAHLPPPPPTCTHVRSSVYTEGVI